MDNGFRITEILKEKGITQTELADRMGISRVGLSKAINGNTTITTLRKIATALDVSLEELFFKPSAGNFTCPNCGTELRLTAEITEKE